MTEIEPPFVEMYIKRIKQTQEKKDPQAEKKAIETINRPIGVLESILGKNDYVLGKTFTIADLNLVSIFTLNDIVKITMQDFTRTEDWIEKCKSRPAYKKMAALR
jgi:glutathione S-transferase